MTNTLTPTITETAKMSRAGKHLTFLLGHEFYGVPVLKVREIMSLCDITPVPEMPDYLRGVLNLRGKIIPVADLRMRFHKASTQNTERTCIVVVLITLADRTAALMGLIVDAVEEVVNLTAADIEPPPVFGAALETPFLLGMAKVKGSVVTLLDIDHVIANEPIQQIQHRTNP
jgi:purine-binding chemotaxis protein CheW